MSDKWNAPPLAGIADPEYQAKIDASVLPPDAALKGIVEIDECFVGGLEANKHESKKLNLFRYVDEFTWRLKRR